MSDTVATLAIVVHCVTLIAVAHLLTRRINIEITNEFSEADEAEDDPADYWKPKRGEQN